MVYWYKENKYKEFLTMNVCAICRNRFEAESPAVLFISAYGNKRVLCTDCEKLLDTACLEGESAEKTEAIEKLESYTVILKDPEVFKTIGALLSGEDLAEDAPSPEEEAAMEEMLQEAAEEDLENPEEKKSNVWDYLLLGGFACAFILFFLWFFFFR